MLTKTGQTNWEPIGEKVGDAIYDLRGVHLEAGQRTGEYLKRVTAAAVTAERACRSLQMPLNSCPDKIDTCRDLSLSSGLSLLVVDALWGRISDLVSRAPSDLVFNM